MPVEHKWPPAVIDLKFYAKAIAQQCVRNNTLLEEAHTRGGALFCDAQMRRLMIAIVDRIYTILECPLGVDALEPFATLPRPPQIRGWIKRIQPKIPELFVAYLPGSYPDRLGRVIAVWAVRNVLRSKAHAGPRKAIGREFETFILEVADNAFAVGRYPDLAGFFLSSAIASWEEPKLVPGLVQVIDGLNELETYHR